MITPILHHPISFEDESPGSFLIRTTESNGWRSTSTLLEALEYRFEQSSYISIESIISNQEKWNYVLESLGISDPLAKNACYHRLDKPHKGYVNFLDIPIPRKMLRVNKPAVCPKCIVEKKYHNKILDFKLITSCSKHAIRLIDSCDDCKRKIGWNRKLLSECQCGKKLEQSSYTRSNTNATKHIEKIIKNKDIKSLDLILELYNVYEKFYKFIKIPVDQHDLVNLCFFSLTRTNKAVKTLNQNIMTTTEIRGIHPRLALHPFLISNKTEVNNIAINCLKKHKYLKPKAKEILGSINITGASRILELSLKNIKLCLSHKILEADENNRTKSYSQSLITLESINNLLIICSKDISKTNNKSKFKTIKELTHSYRYCHTFIGLMKEIVSEKREYSGNKVIVQGLKGIFVRFSSKDKIAAPESTFTVKETAKLCNIHYENIRFAINAGILKHIPHDRTKGPAIYINKKDAYEFQQRYIFSGCIAEKYGFNKKNLAEKIFAAGVNAISGPSIDGGLTYLFRKKDIKSLDMKKVNKISGYQTNTGRKKKNSPPSENNSVPLAKACELLEITIQRALQLRRSGFLIEQPSLSREKRITLKSIQRIVTIKDDNTLVLVTQAAASIKETIYEFRYRWIRTEFFEPIDSGLDLYISKYDLQRIKDFKRVNITASEVDELLGVNKSKIRASEKKNIIKASYKLGIGSQKVFFYNKDKIMSAFHP